MDEADRSRRLRCSNRWGKSRTMRFRVLLSVLMLLAAAATAFSQEVIPIDVRVKTIGRGTNGTAVAVTVWIAPEDRALVGGSLLVRTTISSFGEVVEDLSDLAPVDEVGNATVLRDWPPGNYFLSVMVSSTGRPAVGFSDGDVTIPKADFAASRTTEIRSPVEATPPSDTTLHFLPLPALNSLEAFHMEVVVPDGTTLVEFYQGSKLISRRKRAPWSIRVSTREIVQRSRFRAVALDIFGRYLSEDVIIINPPADDSGIEILIAPENAVTDGRLPVSVALTDQREVLQVSLFLDDELTARWEACPCVTEIPVSDLENAAILTAEIVELNGERSVEVGDTASGFSGTVDVDLVELQVQVFDSHNVPATGLELEDFSVFEDGRRIEIDGIGTVADQPLSLLLAVDSSGSMTKSFPDVRRAVEGFAGGLLEPGDRSELIRFAGDTEILIPWSKDSEDISRGLGDVVPGGSTSLHDAIIYSLMELHTLRGRKAVVLLTDGADTSSFATSADATWFSQTMRVPLFVITLASDRRPHSMSFAEIRHRHRLTTLAEKSGGRAFFHITVNKLPSVYAKIAQILRSQYVIWYRPETSDDADEYRSIKAEVSNPKLKVRTISGYYSGR